jgi:hypothetical protein
MEDVKQAPTKLVGVKCTVSHRTAQFRVGCRTCRTFFYKNYVLLLAKQFQTHAHITKGLGFKTSSLVPAAFGQAPFALCLLTFYAEFFYFTSVYFHCCH